MTKLGANQSSRKLWNNLRTIGIGIKEAVQNLPQLNEFNRSFILRTSQNLDFVPNDQARFDPINEFEFISVSEFEVKETVRSIKSDAIGEDGLPICFVKFI